MSTTAAAGQLAGGLLGLLLEPGQGDRAVGRHGAWVVGAEQLDQLPDPELGRHA